MIFAANTAIIGAYHVFLALSRLRFFPEVVERTSKLRGTPIVSIALATGIPMAILIAVQARLDILGDLYAFGLLGAFSLTCISLDIIRMRERRVTRHTSARSSIPNSFVAMAASSRLHTIPRQCVMRWNARWAAGGSHSSTPHARQWGSALPH